ncbi:MAG: transporter substrate-binding domain-containing protein [Alysiella sp.]|uniref:transporter substrate-binding domain-containing protein n=1 Tax=Alysiella sp. TaxID=1872483 RepID=UPI0026DAD9E4|nr:transporter substrate-binding domain-containing protein [Alysiella sp.]MDO4433706.1 transporter substrate-binding domain-containing protein [Alysiella sp.]
MNFNQYLKASIFLFTGFMLGACSESNTQNKAPVVASQTQMASVAENQTQKSNPDYPTYLVGSELSYEPFAFKDERGLPTGFEVELLQAIAKEAKFNVDFIDAKRGEVVPTLNNGQFSIWASTLSVSPERQEKMDFSKPYMNFSRAIKVLDKPENDGLQSPADFKGKKIAINVGSKTGIDTITELTGSDKNAVMADSYYLSLSEMYKGKADGTLGDRRILQYYQTKNASIKTRLIDLGDEPKNIAFAVKKGNTELVEKINEGFAAVKANGTYEQLLKKWFGEVQ